RKNINADPQLRGISRTNDGTLDPRPATGSPALSGARATPSDGFYAAVNYQGAFGPNDSWLAGWTFLDKAGLLAPVTSEPGIVQVTQSISGNVTWTADKEYVLNGFIY